MTSPRLPVLPAVESDAILRAVGRRMQLARETAGLSTRELARRAGVTHSVLSRAAVRRGVHGGDVGACGSGGGRGPWSDGGYGGDDVRNRFDATVAESVSRGTYAPLSDAGNRPPQVHFRMPSQEGDMLVAESPGVRIECVTGDGRTSRVTIEDATSSPAEPTIVADVTVHVPEGATLTEETIAIASALYWSWWRARDMHGEAPHG